MFVVCGQIYLNPCGFCRDVFGYPVVCTLCVGECLNFVLFLFEAKARRGLRIEFYLASS